MFVRLWMTRSPQTIRAEQTVADVITVFEENKFRRLPVVDSSDKLIGILSQSDAFKLRPSLLDGSATGSSKALLEQTKVEEIMTPQPICVEPLTPLESVARTMRKEKIGGIPVLDNGKLVGIITESDIFAAFTEVLGGNSAGVRVELIIGKSNKEIYSFLDVFKKYRLNLQAITVHHDFGENQRLVTVKIVGSDCDDVLEILQDMRFQINRVTTDT